MVDFLKNHVGVVVGTLGFGHGDECEDDGSREGGNFPDPEWHNRRLDTVLDKDEGDEEEECDEEEEKSLAAGPAVIDACGNIIDDASNSEGDCDGTKEINLDLLGTGRFDRNRDKANSEENERSNGRNAEYPMPSNAGNQPASKQDTRNST